MCLHWSQLRQPKTQPNQNDDEKTQCCWPCVADGKERQVKKIVAEMGSKKGREECLLTCGSGDVDGVEGAKKYYAEDQE